MIRIITLLLVIDCSAAFISGSDATPIFEAPDTESIIAKVGQKITVRGIVSAARKSKGGTRFIIFKDSEFYLVAFKSDLIAFKNGDPADRYKGKHLAITGVVSMYNNKPQMKLLHPDMVRIINDEASEADPVKVKKRTIPKRQALTPAPEKTNSETKKQAPPVDPKKYFK